MKEKREYYFLIDLVKIISVMSIVLLHTSEFIFYSDINPITNETHLYKWVEHFSRYIPFSGQTIIFSIFFIWGINQKRFSSTFKFIFTLLTIHCLMVIPFWGDESYLEAMEWDIYPFIISSYLIVVFLDKIPKLSIFYILTSFLILLIPTSLFQYMNLPFVIRGALIGNCSLSLSGCWPLVPWVFLPVLGYFLGKEIKHRRFINKYELLIWIVALLFGSTQFGKMYDVKMGPNFYCYVLNQSPTVFWGNFIFIIFFFRLSVLRKVQNFFYRNPKAQFISNLAWSKHFGICYILQVLYLIIASQFRYIFQQPLYFDILLISLLPLTELSARFLVKYLRFQKIESIK